MYLNLVIGNVFLCVDQEFGNVLVMFLWKTEQTKININCTKENSKCCSEKNVKL